MRPLFSKQRRISTSKRELHFLYTLMTEMMIDEEFIGVVAIAKLDDFLWHFGWIRNKIKQEKEMLLLLLIFRLQLG